MRLIAASCFAAALLGAGPAWAQTPPSAPSAPPAVRAAPAAPGSGWQRYVNAREVDLQNVAAFIRVRPEDRSDVAVSIVNPGALPAPNLRRSGRRLVIDGRLRGQIRACTVRGVADLEVQTARQGRVTGAQLPIIELRVPEDAVLTVSGAVRLHMSTAETLELRIDGCGDADVERVRDTAEVAVAGHADMRIHDSGELEALVAGDGSITAGIVRDGLTVSIAGPGNFSASRADGATNVVVQGPGHALIRAGRAEDVTVVVNGPGTFTHNGSAETLDALIVGGGEVRVREVEGDISRRVIGGGEVRIGR